MLILTNQLESTNSVLGQSQFRYGDTRTNESLTGISLINIHKTLHVQISGGFGSVPHVVCS